MNTIGEMVVQLTGLERNVELNGKHANMLDYDSKSDRFIVCIDGEKYETAAIIRDRLQILKNK